ncbi:DMT family transporter [Pseudoalteromonas sp. MMG013]|uniref:DMT family transporter n=1 Tax=Pseudoalteromonas sp. MMG013 TaxID=2822687 RepID=UPI001B378B63|nr:DMT family transporter [Pseudoalteromonas sp. MMG013]MBQ4862881.1 DMT family transporter [Pseudoalteromonas sp. MMG013]
MKYFILVLALVCFALNSLIARYVFNEDLLDEVTFTVIRLCSGAFVLILFLLLSKQKNRALSQCGSWYGAIALLVYLIGFSFAYTALDAGFGALILFVVVTFTMVIGGIIQGQKLSLLQWGALSVALLSLAYLLNPSVSHPNWYAVLAMGLSGIGWGAYSLHGTKLKLEGQSPIQSTAGCFLRAMVFVPAIFPFISAIQFSWHGVVIGIICGAITSGVGYVLWYQSLFWLQVDKAATMQLSVPVITLISGVLFLGESVSVIQCICAVLIVLSIGFYLKQKSRLG